MEGDSNEGDINSGCDPDTRSDLDLAFNTRLDPEGLVHEWYGPAISHLRGNRVPGTYHGRGDTWIADQKIAIRRAGHSHEGGHVDSAAATPPWARSCGEG